MEYLYYGYTQHISFNISGLRHRILLPAIFLISCILLIILANFSQSWCIYLLLKYLLRKVTLPQLLKWIVQKSHPLPRQVLRITDICEVRLHIPLNVEYNYSLKKIQSVWHIFAPTLLVTLNHASYPSVCPLASSILLTRHRHKYVLLQFFLKIKKSALRNLNLLTFVGLCANWRSTFFRLLLSAVIVNGKRYLSYIL